MAEKVDSEKNCDAEGEQSDEDSDVVEEEEEEEDDERKDVGKQNSNDPKNRKCSSHGFQGCDAKCQVEDLTPYQVGNHILKCQYLTTNSTRTARDAWGNTSVPNASPGKF